MSAGTIAVLSEGTADAAVAEEAKVTAEAMGCYTFRLLDVGVAGLQRVLKNLPGKQTPKLQLQRPYVTVASLCRTDSKCCATNVTPVLTCRAMQRYVSTLGRLLFSLLLLLAPVIKLSAWVQRCELPTS